MADSLMAPLFGEGFIGSTLFFVIMAAGLAGMIGLLIYLRSRPRDE